MTFELYCVEIKNIPYYNFLCLEEYESLYVEFENYYKEYERRITI